MAARTKPSNASTKTSAQKTKSNEKNNRNNDSKNKSNNVYPFEFSNFKQNFHQLFDLLRKDGVVFECDAEAPSPSKDYGQLQITTDKVLLRWWKITLRNIEGTIYPGEIKDSYEDFYHDEIAQLEIQRIFGQITLDYCLNLVRGHIDWLNRLPEKLQVHILSFVNLEDVPQISLVSKSFRTLCRNNDLWKSFYIRYYDRQNISRELINLAEKRGWRHVFFTNRLKLQMQLRRESQRLPVAIQDDTTHLERQRTSTKHRKDLASSLMKINEYDTRFTSTRHYVNPSIRRHSFSIKTITNISENDSFEGEEISPRSIRSSYVAGGGGDYYRMSPLRNRTPSPTLSTRSMAGSVASKGSQLEPVHPYHERKKR
ncbi:unnamed protein product [Didymodactylos carnosus]|uniref:F-box domain-containing protein n=1 Tax=Didymodactylos carnosus TaxID=1234261 RepID=A0A814LUS4_9BILA|nr:unnamed protein product [Didymodactylos carnosus]CAF1430711.1 unnamed protein product [Didymodactylos carnosus]CAF3835464.1 unnamed protein product [Didymodactylos carnosus]CAF4228856.1 unnamed protein product [Didymodactylos carnosus]